MMIVTEECYGNEYENVDQLLSRFDSFGGADFHFVNGRIHF